MYPGQSAPKAPAPSGWVLFPLLVLPLSAVKGVDLSSICILTDTQIVSRKVAFSGKWRGTPAGPYSLYPRDLPTQGMVHNW